jgi:hypothetical protein
MAVSVVRQARRGRRGVRLLGAAALALLGLGGWRLLAGAPYLGPYATYECVRPAWRDALDPPAVPLPGEFFDPTAVCIQDARVRVAVALVSLLAALVLLLAWPRLAAHRPAAGPGWLPMVMIGGAAGLAAVLAGGSAGSGAAAALLWPVAAPAAYLASASMRPGDSGVALDLSHLAGALALLALPLVVLAGGVAELLALALVLAGLLALARVYRSRLLALTAAALLAVLVLRSFGYP